LRYFDRISFHPVGADELLDLRAQMAAGRGRVDIVDGEFALADYRQFLADNAATIADFRRQQGVAFANERQAWDRAGEFAETRAS
jgi:urea carboxylase